MQKNYELKNLKIKIGLPAEITLNIPSLNDIELEDCMHYVSQQGVKYIKDVIKDKVLQRFVEIHKPLIGDVVERLVNEKSDEIKKLLELK